MNRSSCLLPLLFLACRLAAEPAPTLSNIDISFQHPVRGRIIGNTVEVRESLDLKSKVKAILKKDDIVMIIEKNAGSGLGSGFGPSYKIISQDGYMGWSSMNSVLVLPPTFIGKTKSAVAAHRRVKKNGTITLLEIGDGTNREFGRTPARDSESEEEYDDRGIPFFAGIVAGYYAVIIPHYRYENTELRLINIKDGGEIRSTEGEVNVSPWGEFLLLNTAAMCCGPHIQVFRTIDGKPIGDFSVQSIQNSGAVWISENKFMYWEDNRKENSEVAQLYLKLVHQDERGHFSVVESVPIR